ncbi:MAG: peptidase [Pirellulales bacterium]
MGTARGIDRRQFLSTSAAATAVCLAAPSIVTAQKTDQPLEVGQGEHRYRVHHNWAQLPSQFTWQTTHNVAVDSEGLVYVIHEGQAELKDHPSIFVFDRDGRYVRSFGKQFQGGGHGIEVRREGNTEYLYVCAYQQVKSFAKLSLKGETVWQKYAPLESQLYPDEEAKNPQKIWGRDRFMPTNFAFLPDGGFLLADGYGSFYIHRYDAQANWVSCFGGPGEGQGKFDTPHGIWINEAPGAEATIVITDRAHHTLQTFSMEGKYLQTVSGFGLPANVSTFESLLLVPELLGRVSLLDRQLKTVATLGDDAQRIKDDSQHAIRQHPEQWQAGKFVHPHDACFDQQGNIYVAEWVATGRVTKLERIV